mgnify:FL=1
MVTQIGDKTNAMRQNNLMEVILGELSQTRFNKIEHISETGSTNSDLVSKASELGDGFILVSDHQTDGKGRLERHWEAPPSRNLLFSVLLHPKWSMERHQLVTPALALATVEVLERLGLRATVKWPNDVMVEKEGEKKIAGILAEYVKQENPVLVVGMGLNIEWPLQEDPAPPKSISLRACGIEKDRFELLVEILKNFEKRLIEISSEKGTSTFRQAYTAKSSTIGNQVKVQKSEDDIIGNAIDIEENGSLIIENENGITSITAGDVIHLRKL